jgi:regulator of RNase E activity RraA
VQIAGVTVSPGDVVIADGSGVVVVPQSLLQDVATRADELVEREAGLLAAIREGVRASVVMDSTYDAMLGSPDEQASHQEGSSGDQRSAPTK